VNHPYLPVLIFFGVALAVPIASLTLARVWMSFFTPIKRGKEKNALYECGVNPLAERQTRFHSQYYLFGLLFLLFDVETVFLLPFAVAFLQLSTGAFLVAMAFLLLLAEGLVWAWSKGLLNWRGPAKPDLTIFGA
jgi:NADH-quinone oxidoreductase subunit A